jgi:adenine-specific DNA-methyltransferase
MRRSASSKRCGKKGSDCRRRAAEPAFPSTRYQGSKAKLAPWILSRLSDLPFDTCLDAFSGTAAVAYQLKKAGRQVTCNDILKFNALIATALVANRNIRVEPHETESLLERSQGRVYPTLVAATFPNVYFTDEENAWIDRTITNVRAIEEPCKHALAFFALCQACLIKRPFNLFHRKNVYLRHSKVPRSFGNKTSWDRPFEHWFRRFITEANAAVFDNGRKNRALNLDIFDVEGDFDLVYIDTPYVSGRRVGTDYLSYYHFLEGLANYDRWEALIDGDTKNLGMKKVRSEWTDPKRVSGAFDRLFHKFRRSIVAVSYRNDGIPSEEELAALLRKYKRNVRVERFGRYRYALSRNESSHEILLIGT